MTKNEFLKQPFDEILNMATTTSNLLRQRIEGQSVLTIALKNFSNEKIIQLIQTSPDILLEKNEESVPYVEVLADLNKPIILENFSDKINLLQKTYDGEKNMLGYFLKKGFNNLVIACLENDPSVLNKKDPVGCVGTERMVDVNFSSGLLTYASEIDLSQRSYDGEKNMLGYLAAKGMSNVILKALEKNPDVLNEKDPVGCVGTERLVDAGFSNILEVFAEHINLLKYDYQNEKNMLGYMTKKGMSNVVAKALEANPAALNEKDPAGCVGTERLVDAGYSNILETYAEHINLLKYDYQGQKNMLGYIAAKGMSNVILRALEKNPEALNEKDPVGCVGTERLVDAGFSKILEQFAPFINLLRYDYQGQKNMLGYISAKGMSDVVLEALTNNPTALNEKDPVGCPGSERLVDAGNISTINKLAMHINWSRKSANDQSIFQYVLKKSGSQAEEIAMKALTTTPDLLYREMKFIIDSGLTNVLSYAEIVKKVDKNMSVGDMNLLGYLTHKGKEKYVDIILNPDKAEYYFDNNQPKIHISQQKEKALENIQLTKELIIEKLEKKTEPEEEIVPPKSIKAKIKSML